MQLRGAGRTAGTIGRGIISGATGLRQFRKKKFRFPKSKRVQQTVTIGGQKFILKKASTKRTRVRFKKIPAQRVSIPTKEIPERAKRARVSFITSEQGLSIVD